MVGSVADDTGHPADNARRRGRRSAGLPAEPVEYEQLALDATITGPGRQTEDPYEPGTQLRIKGERGIFTYKHATVSRTGRVSLHLVRNHMFRAVRPDQVTVAKKGSKRS